MSVAITNWCCRRVDTIGVKRLCLRSAEAQWAPALAGFGAIVMLVFDEKRAVFNMAYD